MNDAPTFPLESEPAAAAARTSAAGPSAATAEACAALRDMRFAELAYRGWQEASKWLERVAPVEPPDHPEALLRKHAPELADPDEALRILRDVAPQRFFAGVDGEARAALGSIGCPITGAELIARADALLKRHFDLLGYRTLWFGDPIDWHLDPLTGRRAPLVAVAAARTARRRSCRRQPARLGVEQASVARPRWRRHGRSRGDERYAEACVQRDRRMARREPARASASTGRAASKSRSG